MFRIISNLIASFLRHASIAQRLDDAVSFADGQCELVKDLQSELANTYRRIDALRTDIEVGDRHLRSLRARFDSVQENYSALSCERDALKNELATLRAVLLSEPMTITGKQMAELNELADRADPFDGGCAHDCADRR